MVPEMTVMTVIPTQHREDGFRCKRMPLTTVFAFTDSIGKHGQDGQDSQARPEVEKGEFEMKRSTPPQRASSMCKSVRLRYSHLMCKPLKPRDYCRLVMRG